MIKMIKKTGFEYIFFKSKKFTLYTILKKKINRDNQQKINSKQQKYNININRIILIFFLKIEIGEKNQPSMYKLKIFKINTIISLHSVT